jgi:hypothetical protein
MAASVRPSSYGWSSWIRLKDLRLINVWIVAALVLKTSLRLCIFLTVIYADVISVVAGNS